MNARIKLCIALLCVGLSATQPARAQRVAPSANWAGTWQLNPHESKFSSGSATGREKRTIAISHNRMSVDSAVTTPAGKALRFRYSVALDGRFYPLVGNPDGDSIAMRLLSPAKVAIEVRRDGKRSATATSEVTANRLRMERHRLPLSGSPSDDVLVYDRVR